MAIERLFVEDEVKTVSLESLNLVEDIYLSAQGPVKESVRGGWDAEKTVALTDYGQDRMLFVGWLVCIDGAMRGKDYRLYPGFNRVGRNIGADICVQDPEVAGENHCAVVYEERKGEFYVVPGKGTLTWLDGETLQQAEKLSDGSRIRLGKTTLELAAFCKGEHVWKEM